MSDEANFNKFVRFFTMRLIQSLVQGRLGTKVEQACSAVPDQSDWFNTKVDELGEIAAYLRSAVKNYPPKCRSLTLEFLLCTADGQYLSLETWVLSLDSQTENQVNVSTELYHQLGTLLRSATAAARVTPMYRYYVRKQGLETFVILYRVYEGQGQASLGEQSKHTRLGHLPSPFGGVCLDLYYRTQMVLPQPAAAAPEIAQSPPTNQMAKLNLDLPCRPSFSDCIPVTGGEPQLTSPMSTTFWQFATSPIHSPSPGPTKFRLGRSTSSEESSQSESHSIESRESLHSHSMPRILPNSFPFASLLSSSYGPIKRTSVSTHDILEEEPEERESVQSTESARRHGSNDGSEASLKDERESDTESSEESYEKICGFGPSDSLGCNLGQFIRDCRGAPGTLDAFTLGSSDSLNAQLCHLAAQQSNFDAFVRRLNEEFVDDD